MKILKINKNCETTIEVSQEELFDLLNESKKMNIVTNERTKENREYWFSKRNNCYLVLKGGGLIG